MNTFSFWYAQISKCAAGETRTLKLITALAPKASVSTNSTTAATVLSSIAQLFNFCYSGGITLWLIYALPFL